MEAAVFLYENEEGSWKLSLRSNGKVNVAEIAVRHGGGGHVRAAGATMEGEAQEVIQAVLEEIQEQLSAWGIC